MDEIKEDKEQKISQETTMTISDSDTSLDYIHDFVVGAVLYQLRIHNFPSLPLSVHKDCSDTHIHGLLN